MLNKSSETSKLFQLFQANSHIYLTACHYFHQSLLFSVKFSIILYLDYSWFYLFAFFFSFFKHQLLYQCLIFWHNNRSNVLSQSILFFPLAEFWMCCPLNTSSVNPTPRIKHEPCIFLWLTHKTSTVSLIHLLCGGLILAANHMSTQLLAHSPSWGNRDKIGWKIQGLRLEYCSSAAVKDRDGLDWPLDEWWTLLTSLHSQRGRERE